MRSMMNFPNTSPSPENLLADRSWRLRHSAWLLAPLLGCGMLSFVGFLYVAIRVQTKKFWIAATVGCVGSAAVWIIMALAGDLEEPSQAAGTADGASTTSDLGVGVAMAAWAGLLVYAVVLNRDYLRWRAAGSESNAWYNQPVGTAARTNVAYVAPPSPPSRPQISSGSTRTTTSRHGPSQRLRLRRHDRRLRRRGQQQPSRWSLSLPSQTLLDPLM